MAQPSTSPTATSARSTAVVDLDRAVAELQDHAREFARLGPGVKARLLRSCLPRAVEVAGAWSARGLEAKGLPATSAEEWLAGPVPVVRHLRLLAESLDVVAVAGRPALGTGVRRRDDGRLEVDVFPASGLERLRLRGTSAATCCCRKGSTPRRAGQAGELLRRARSRRRRLRWCSAPATCRASRRWTCFTKLFIEGYVCLLKMNPVNEWVGPILERALAPLCDAGFLRIVYGGADVGEYLVEHAGIDDVHITGSDKTHDLIVWGPPGPERERRQAADEPLLARPITSRARQREPGRGRAAPVLRRRARVPGPERGHDGGQQRLVQLQRGQDAGHRRGLAAARGVPRAGRRLPRRRSPPARPTTRARGERYAQAHRGPRRSQRSARRAPASCRGRSSATSTPATRDDPLFSTEPFCALLSETTVGSADPARVPGRGDHVHERHPVGHAERGDRHRARARA